MEHVRRSIEISFDTGHGDVTTAAIVSGCLVAVEGRLAQERVIGRVENYEVRVVRPDDSQQVAA